MKNEYLVTFTHVSMYNGLINSVAGIIATDIEDATKKAKKITPEAGLDIRYVFISNIQRVG